jgi:hypothetical protein
MRNALRKVAAIALFAAALGAQSSTTTARVSRREAYSLDIRSSNAGTVAYLYSVSGLLLATGRYVTVSGIIERADVDGVTSVRVDLGGAAVDIQAQISDLAVTAVTLGSKHRVGRIE